MTGQVASLAGLFVANRHLLIVALLTVALAGLSAFLSLPRIEDPRITTRNATIVTPWPGASATRVEALVTKPIEDRLRELPEIKTIESTSRSGVSVIGIELQDRIGEKDNEQAFSRIRDRLDAATAELPQGVGRPAFDDMRGAVAFSMVYAVAWRDPDRSDIGMLNRFAGQLGDRLRNLDGTEQVVLFGIAEEEIRVDVDAQEAAAIGLSPAGLAARIAAADARRSAGTVRADRYDLPLEISGALDSAARVAAIPIAGNGRGGLVHVRDIATVTKAWQDPPEQIALHDGHRSILVAARTAPDIRVDRWAQAARATVTSFTAGLPAGLAVDAVFDQSRYTAARLGELTANLLVGAACVMLVVALTMGWRAALIVGTALPLSAALALFGLNVMGEPIHQMAIFGMIIAIGLLIDNAIVVTDQVIARRRAGQAPGAAVSATIRHLFGPLFASTATTVLGFMPVFLLPGNIGDFVSPIATAVILALLASFVLAMTVIPALAGLLAFAGQPGGQRWWRDGMRAEAVTVRYRGLLSHALARPRLSLLAAGALPVAGLVLAGGLGMQFFPSADRDQLEIQVWMPGGTNLASTTARLLDIEQAVRAHAGVIGITWVAGASSPPVYYNQLRQQDNNPTYGRGVIKLADVGVAQRLESVLQDELAPRFRDAQIVVRAFGQGPPVAAPVGLRLFGPDPDRLREIGEQVRAVLHRQPSVTHTLASVQGGEAKLWLDADESQARLAGLTLDDIAGQFQAALDGSYGGRVLEDLEDLPVRIRHAGPARDSADAIGSLRLRTDATPGWLPASALGEVRMTPELRGITRRNGERVNEISAYLRQGALPIEVTRAVLAEIEAGAVALPPGYRIEPAGDSAEQQRAIGQLLVYAPLLATLMVGVLVLTFGSFALAALLGVVALLSVGLGLLSLWVGGFPLGFNPIIGTAGLIGVAINGSIVVLAALRANPAARAGDREAIVAETIGASRHILSTTLTTVGGFLPLLLLSGGQFWPPLAIVLAGGVGLSALLSLLFTPVAYAWLTGTGLLTRTGPE